MRYILNDLGYIQAVSFNNAMVCNNKTCTEYTGIVPTGYESLAEWNENANINAYKIVEGNLTYDSEEDTRLQSLWASQENEKDIIPTKTSQLENDSNFISDNSYVHTDNNYTTDEKNKLQKLGGIVLYENSSGSNGTITLNETSANFSYIKIFFQAEDIYNSVEIPNPNGKLAYLHTSTVLDGNNYYKQFWCCRRFVDIRI